MNYESTRISLHDLQKSVTESVLQSLVSTDYTLVLNAQSQMLTLLNTHPPFILTHQHFTKNEWSVLLVLLASYPHYAPYEILLASLTSLSSNDCRERVQQAQHLGQKMLKRELKPIYRALSGIRVKLNDLYPHLKVSHIRDTGYVLTTSVE